ncbi:hypothetical protein C0989_003510, partial [Termitomyces sp. Mn162]
QQVGLINVNPDIDWRNLTMQFAGPEASLAAAIPLCLLCLDPNAPAPKPSNSKATHFPTNLKDNWKREESAPLPQLSLNTPQRLPSNILQN